MAGPCLPRVSPLVGPGSRRRLRAKPKRAPSAPYIHPRKDPPERWPSVGTRARVEPSPECVCGPRWPLHPSHPGRAGWHPPSLSRLAGKPRRYSNRKLLAGGSPTIILPVNGKNKELGKPRGPRSPTQPRFSPVLVAPLKDGRRLVPQSPG